MLVQIAQLFLSLTILITLHEFGHFWFAKRFGCKVEKFYLFFDFLFPFPNIANFALFKKKIGDTEYGLGWFPFGGYVSIAGMVDEQMDKEIIEKPAEPWELRSKPAWQRLLVMMGGILVNFILGILIFWMMLLAWGKNTQPIVNFPNGLMVDSTAYNMGLRNGDYITSLDGMPFQSVRRIPVEIVMNGIKQIEGVHADGTAFTIAITDQDRSEIMKGIKHGDFVMGRFVAKVGAIDSTSFAANANLKVDDIITAVNGVNVRFYDELRAQLVSNRGKKVQLTVQRGAATHTTNCQVSEEGIIGFRPAQVEKFKVDKQGFTFFEALTQGTKDGVELIVMQAKQFVVLFTVKDAHKQISGFYTMANQMSSEWDWQSFWMFTGFLSLALAFMNFLPIPMLDGGYIMFILWEMVTGKKVSDKVIYYANNVGLVIVLALMVYANTDWLRN